MLRATLACLVLVCGCYQPHPVEGAPCGDGEACPSGLTCFDGFCRSAKVWLDAAPQEDAMVDARPIDAPLDAFVDVGCADGTREGFVDLVTYPTIAGCAATWTGTHSLREARTTGTCGGTVACTAPEDACAANWHVCARNGLPSDLTSRINSTACLSAGGASGTAFVAATSHCSSFGTPCVYTTPYGCPASGTCSEPVCCGPSCSSTNGCKAAVYADPDTHIGGTIDNGCGALLAADVNGVLCCHD
jgi:hypothetical protein